MLGRFQAQPGPPSPERTDGRPTLSGSLEGVTSEFRIAPTWLYNWSAGLIFGATGIAGRAPSFWRGFGAKFGRKWAENRPINQNSELPMDH